MAILTDNESEVEVQIIRHPDYTEFKEYVKIADREEDCSLVCERYIVSEPGLLFSVSIKLKEGFMFGCDTQVVVGLHVSGIPQAVAKHQFLKPDYVWDGTDGTREDMTAILSHADKSLQNIVLKISGAQFQIQRLVAGLQIFGLLLNKVWIHAFIGADEDLKAETDVVGVSPHDLGHFSVSVVRRIATFVSLTEAEREQGDEQWQELVAF